MIRRPTSTVLLSKFSSEVPPLAGEQGRCAAAVGRTSQGKWGATETQRCLRCSSRVLRGRKRATRGAHASASCRIWYLHAREGQGNGQGCGQGLQSETAGWFLKC